MKNTGPSAGVMSAPLPQLRLARQPQVGCHQSVTESDSCNGRLPREERPIAEYGLCNGINAVLSGPRIINVPALVSVSHVTDYLSGQTLIAAIPARYKTSRTLYWSYWKGLHLPQ
jgi:hypothetical protein